MISFFSLPAFKILSLSLIFDCLKIMCLGENILSLICLGTYELQEHAWSNLFPDSSFQPLFFKISFLPPFPFPLTPKFANWFIWWCAIDHIHFLYRFHYFFFVLGMDNFKDSVFCFLDSFFCLTHFVVDTLYHILFKFIVFFTLVFLFNDF